MQWVYLDNNATTQPEGDVVRAMGEIHQSLWANPSSVHRFGQLARQRVELARTSMANLIGCRDRNIVFTSGGTESNILALRGVLCKRLRTKGSGRRLLITTQIEHSAIREPAAELAESGVELVHTPLDHDGVVEVDRFAEILSELGPKNLVTLVSIQWANNETGVIQPIDQLVAICRSYQQCSRSGVIFHCDATQAVGKLPVDVAAIGVDLLTWSAHKFHGPKGVGALYLRRGLRLRRQQSGGPQEQQWRGGTENTAGIVGMGTAAELARRFLKDEVQIKRLAALRDRFEAGILDRLPDTTINGGGAASSRLWNTSNLGFPGLEAEAILMGLSEKGVCASAGAACSSGSLDPSPVLLAMGVPEPIAHGSIRFSLSRHTTGEEIDRTIVIVPQIVQKLRKILPVQM